MWTKHAIRNALLVVAVAVATTTAGCAAPTNEDEETEDGIENGEGGDDDSAVEPEQVGTTSAELRSGECSVSVMFPRIGSTGVSAASNAWGRCRNARRSSLHFMMRTNGIHGWSTRWNFTQNVRDNGSYNLGGRQVSLAAVSEIYVEATVCWTERIRRCRSDNALLRYLN